MPYELVPPTLTQSGWGPVLNANLISIRDRMRTHELAYSLPLDSFPGSTDDAKFAAALSHAAAQTYSPTIVLPPRAITLSGGPYNYFPGLRLTGPLGAGEREFTSTGPQCVVTVGGGGLFAVPAGGVRNMWFSNIQFRAASGSVNWQVRVTDLSGGPIIQDATWERCAWVGFSSVMHARHLRVLIDQTYVNNSTDTPFKLGGSDNYYWPTGGFLSSTTQSASTFYVWFTHMSRTNVGPLYITPERATGIRIDGSYGDLVFTRTKLDSTGRTVDTACQGAAILITGGKGMVFDKLWFFNNAVNPAATGRSPVDKGQVYIRGNAADLLFSGCSFSGGDAQTSYTPAGTPAIYAANTVSNVKVLAPIAPNGGIKLLQHQAGGIITTALATDWTLAIA